MFTNLLPNSIYGDKEKEKKTLPEFRDNNISRITAQGKKKKVIRRKKRKGQLCHTNWKNQEIRNQLVKRTKTHCKMLWCYNYKDCSILGWVKLQKLIRESGLSYYSFAYNGSSGCLIHKSVLGTLRSHFRWNYSRIVPTRELIYIYIYIYTNSLIKQPTLSCYTNFP